MSGNFRNYDLAPNGRRFRMVKEAEEQSATTQLNMVLNWFEELRRRAPR